MNKILKVLVNSLCLFIVLVISNLSLASAPSKYALLIGIDEYEAVTDLRGTVNDVELMQGILTSKFGVPEHNIKLLTNENATRENIITAIQVHLIKQAQSGDVVILHYSGHGSQMKDEPGGDEIDGYDETIVAHDSRTEGVFDISDDEINGLLTQLTQKTKNVTFIMDSCHSGTVARAGSQARIIEPDNRIPPPKTDFAISFRNAESDEGFRLDDSDYVLISGSRSSELANETRFNDRRYGAMTWYLAQELLNAKPDATYRSVMDNVKANVNSRFRSQHPQIEGPGMDLKLFGTDKINSRPYALINSIENGVAEINAGRILGVKKGSELKVFSADTTDFDNSQPTGIARVISVDDFIAEAVINEGESITPQAKVLLDRFEFGDQTTNLFVEQVASEELVQITNRLIEESQILALVESAADATLIIQQQQDAIMIYSGDMSELALPILVTEDNYEDMVVNKVKDIIHWQSLRDLRNPSSQLRVSIEIRKKEDPPEIVNPLSVAKGQRVVYRVKNLLDEQDLYIYVLDVSSDGSVSLLHPPQIGAQQTLAAGASLEREVEMYIPDQTTSVVDVFKVIATTQAIDPNIFPQGAVRSASPPANTRSTSDPLSRYLASATRATRAARPINIDSWTTSQQSVVVQLPQARTSGFTLSFKKPVDRGAIQTTIDASRSVCPVDQVTDDCLELKSVSSDNSVFEMNSESMSRSSDGNRSIGRIFEEAYQIQTHTGAIRVEPKLEVKLPGVIDEQGIDKREVFGDTAHDQAARDDDQWHLKQLNAKNAWEKIRLKHGLSEGYEASGIFVAHTDTGYLEHPENWEVVNGIKPIDESKGYDYFDGDTVAKDELLDGFLDNPAHGTASGSVIVSPTKCQLEGAQKCVNGVARGAQLIPLRVHKTVSQIDTSNLAHAIRDVADGNIETYLFLVMDYCEGGDLGKLLQRKKKLDEATTKAFAC